MWCTIFAKKEKEVTKMHKSVYSVILSDELVNKLDAVAYKKGVSRSVMLDRILAGYLTEETVEMKMNGVFAEMGRIIEQCSGLRFTNQASDYMAFVQSALLYKYNPTVKYSIELFPSGDLGQLKISLRSGSETLMRIMRNFYDLFIFIENKYIGDRTYGFDGTRFVRVLKRPNATSKETGEYVADYIADFDGYLRIYFSYLGDEEKASREVEKKYAENIAKKEVIL